MWCAWSTHPGSSLSFALCVWAHGYYSKDDRTTIGRVVLIVPLKTCKRTAPQESTRWFRTLSQYAKFSTSADLSTKKDALVNT